MTDAHFSPEALALMEQVKADRYYGVKGQTLDALIALMPAPAHEPSDAEVEAANRLLANPLPEGPIHYCRRLHAAGFRWAPDE